MVSPPYGSTIARALQVLTQLALRVSAREYHKLFATFCARVFARFTLIDINGLRRRCYSAVARLSVAATGLRNTPRRLNHPAARASRPPVNAPASGTQGEGRQLNSKT